MRFVSTNELGGIAYGSLQGYRAPGNLNYLWNFGSYTFAFLISQVISGIYLAMYYVQDSQLAFDAVEHIVRDVRLGWFFRQVHANGASALFFFIYSHMFRGFYYGSYLKPRGFLWVSGILLLVLMVAVAFLGYVLPWGQMSFWAATVITSLFSAIPIFGKYVVVWLWGGFSVGAATLGRFFSLHYLLPFLMLGLVAVHFMALHQNGSNNPLGIPHQRVFSVALGPEYVIKDFFGLIMVFFIFTLFVFFSPYMLGHPDNFMESNAMVTPSHIVPEWYFLMFYAILRSITNKLFGVIALGFAILSLFLVPFLFSFSTVRSLEFHPISKHLFWFLLLNFFLLSWLGSCSVEFPYTTISKLCVFFYFVYFLGLAPLAFFFETVAWVPTNYGYGLLKNSQ